VPTREQQLSRVFLWSALAAGAAVRLWLAFTDDGIYWPDEVYQSLEPAHRLVFGYGLTPWEFIEGARNWALPGLVAGLLKLSALVGLDAPRQYVTLVKACFALCGAATAYGSYRLARAYGVDGAPAAVAGALFALAAPAIYFAPRAMSETASALPVVLGLAFALKPGPRRWELLLGASLLGLAVLLRLQNALFCVGFLAILLARRDGRRALEAFGVLMVWAFLLGLLDHLTWADAPSARWGGWFHSAVKYLEFNLINDGAKAWGVSDGGFYFKQLFLTMPVGSLLLAALSLVALRRAPGLGLTAFAFLGLHSWVGHKELRFLYPVLPVFCALAGIGLSVLPRKVMQGAAAVTALAAVWSGLRFHALTMGDVGQYPDRKASSAYDDSGPVNRMLFAAHDQPDLCGVRVDIAHLAWTGGSTYLHRRAPLYHLGQPPVELRLFNYVITYDTAGLGQVVARDARVPQVVLVRLPMSSCATDVRYPWRLP
jgi:hypothetical protein